MPEPTQTGDSRTVAQRVYGACGVDGCRDCYPVFDADTDEPTTDDDGRLL